MPGTAAVFWLLDNLLKTTGQIDPRTAYSLSHQVRSTNVTILKELRHRGQEPSLSHLVALSESTLDSLVLRSLVQFGFRHEKSNVSLHDYLLEAAPEGQRRYLSLPPTVVICAPSGKERNVLYRLSQSSRSSILCCQGAVIPGPLREYNPVIWPMEAPPPLPTILPNSQSSVQAALLWDIENYVNTRQPMQPHVLPDLQTLLLAIYRYLGQHHISVNPAWSIVCIRHLGGHEMEFARTVAPYDLQTRVSIYPGEPAEQRIVNRVMELIQSPAFRSHRNKPKQAILMSGDGHTLPALRRLQQAGIPVWVIAWRANTNPQLKEEADKYISLETVLEETGLFETISPSTFPAAWLPRH